MRKTDILMGQYVPGRDIDLDEVKEYLEDRIRCYVNTHAYDCYTKEYRESEEWRDMDLSRKLSQSLNYGNIDDFIDCLIGDV